MESALETFEPYHHSPHAAISRMSSALGRWVSEIFGCQHKEMSRPFSRQGETFRVCITCGARRQFDEKNWNTVGPFYFKGAHTSELVRH
jgi:hypothetical protein